MKKKIHNVGTIRDRDLKKRVRKELPPTTAKTQKREGLQSKKQTQKRG